MLGEVAAQEHHFVVTAEVKRAELLGHAPLADHLARQICRGVDIIGSARGDLSENDLFGDPAAHGHCDLIVGQILRHIQAVFDGKLLRKTERAATWNDRHFVNRIRSLHHLADQGVTTFVVRGHALVFVADDKRTALGPHQDLVLGVFEVVAIQLVLVVASGEQRCLVDQVF